MLKKAALVFGAILLGFVPALTPKDSMGMPLLLGLFMVGTVHNIIHLVTGLAGLLASSSAKNSRLFFQVFGIVYALVTVIGFIQGDTVLGLIHVNLADNLLHLAIAATSLYFGFAKSDREVTAV
jgi:hypothetical protein